MSPESIWLDLRKAGSRAYSQTGGLGSWQTVGSQQGDLESLQSAQFSLSVVSDSLRPHGLQHARPPCPSPTLAQILFFLGTCRPITDQNPKPSAKREKVSHWPQDKEKGLQYPWGGGRGEVPATLLGTGKIPFSFTLR